MSRRSMCMILVVMLTLWGVGLPRFVHVMTAHVPPSETGKQSLIAVLFTVHSSGTEWRSCSRCCSSCSLATKPVDAETEVEPDADVDADCGDESHHCGICELLATLMTNVPAMPAASVAWQPVIEHVLDAPSRVVVVESLDSHSARGPPMSA